MIRVALGDASTFPAHVYDEIQTSFLKNATLGQFPVIFAEDVTDGTRHAIGTVVNIGKSSEGIVVCDLFVDVGFEFNNITGEMICCNITNPNSPNKKAITDAQSSPGELPDGKV